MRRGCEGIALGLCRLLLVGKEQLTPGLAQVPFGVVGEHAQEDAGPHPMLEPVVNRTDLQINRLQRAKCALDLGLPLVVAHKLRCIHSIGRHCGADHVQTIERRLGFDRGGVALAGQPGVAPDNQPFARIGKKPQLRKTKAKDEKLTLPS